MTAPARRAAFRALQEVATGRRDSASALARSRQSLTDARDLALTTELVTGVLRWQSALDAGLAPLSSTPFDHLDLPVRTTLRLAAYQLIYLTRIPASAAVNDAVSLVREAGLTKATGLVNAVLRRVDRARFINCWPTQPAAASSPATWIDYLSTTLSHPRWLVERWLARMAPSDVARWELFNNGPPRLTIRPVRWKTDRDRLIAMLTAYGIQCEPGRWAPDAVSVGSSAALLARRELRGHYVAQDEASQLVAQLAVDLRPLPASVLDLCAAPGGKTTYLRAYLPDAQLVACDRRSRRIQLLRDSLAAVDTPRVNVVQLDATAPLPFTSHFDLVVADVPCSGLGTIRREPDIRWRRQASDLVTYSTTQRQILSQAACLVSPRNGRLLYATCSSEPEENELVVNTFLAATPTFRRLRPQEHPWHDGPLRALLDRDLDLRTQPAEHALEAFYAAVLVREDPTALSVPVVQYGDRWP